MKKLIIAALLTSCIATAANAQLTTTPGNQTPPAGSTVVTFDSPLPNGFSLTGGEIDQGTNLYNNQAPLGDTTKYLAVTGGNTATLVANAGYKTVGFYWGSVGPADVANIFDSLGKLITSITAPQAQGAGPSRTPISGLANNYVSYTVDPNLVPGGIKSVSFSAGINSFELDAIGRIVDLYSPQECSNYFAAAGYDAD